MTALKRERICKILNHDLFLNGLMENERAEENRNFCRHNMAHFLDVARLAEILNMKEEQEIEDELIYAAALLHDIGKYIQYKDGTPHETTGAQLAKLILQDCGFGTEEVKVITEAIGNHRNEEMKQMPGLEGLLYRADKMSRCCFACRAERDCNWDAKKKNMSLTW